jgi:hypothetical protein
VIDFCIVDEKGTSFNFCEFFTFWVLDSFFESDERASERVSECETKRKRDKHWINGDFE